MKKAHPKSNIVSPSKLTKRTKTVFPPDKTSDVVKAIGAWDKPGCMSWSDVLDVVAIVTKTRFTRQTLNRKPEIKGAYDAKVASWRQAAAHPKRFRRRKPQDIEKVETLRKQILFLDGIIETQKATIKQQDERINKFFVMFSTWQTALLERTDITIEALNVPLVPAQRI